MPFLRNELTKDVEKVIGKSEAVVLLDSSDRVIYDKLTDQYLLEATLVGKNKAQVKANAQFFEINDGRRKGTIKITQCRVFRGTYRTS